MPGGGSAEGAAGDRAGGPYLILAAAEAGKDGEAPPPPELVLAWQCQEWHALPRAGGLWEQPAGLMSRLRTLSEVYRAHQAYQHKRQDEASWSLEHPGWFGIVVDVDEMRRKHGR